MNRRCISFVLIFLTLFTLGFICVVVPGSLLSHHPVHRPVGKVFSSLQSPHSVHVALVVFGKKALEDAYTLIKSIVLLTQSDVHFHVFSTDNAGHALNTRVANWPARFTKRITIYPRVIDCDKWIKNVHDTTTKTLSISNPDDIKTCMFLNLEQSNISKLSSKLIFLDIDMVAVDDVINLWKQYEHFNSSHIMAMARAGKR